MRTHELWDTEHPDMSSRIIHLTGRIGTPSDDIDPAILEMHPEERLTCILNQKLIAGFKPFGGLTPAICFTECTDTSVEEMINKGRYAPYGVAFEKQTVFENGGGPALYVRGDEWPLIKSAPKPLQARATRYWPGADPDMEGEELPAYLEKPSLWTFEREWRVPGDYFEFDLASVAYVLVPDDSAMERIVDGLIYEAQLEFLQWDVAMGWSFDDPIGLIMQAEADERCTAARTLRFTSFDKNQKSDD